MPSARLTIIRQSWLLREERYKCQSEPTMSSPEVRVTGTKCRLVVQQQQVLSYTEKLNLQEHPLQHKEAGEDSYRSGIWKCEEYLSQIPVEVTGCGFTKELSSNSEYFSCVSSLPRLPPPDTHDIRTSEEYAPQVLAEVPGGGPTEERSCSSEYFSCVSSLFKLAPPDTHDIRKIQEYASQSQIHVEALGCGPPNESSSSSHHLTCASSTSKHFSPKNHRTPVMPASMDLQQAATFPPSAPASSPFGLFSKNKPCTPLVPGRDERVMTVYYMRVQMKRGRAVLQDPEEGGLEPSSKKMKIEEMTYIEKVFENIPISQMSTKRPLVDRRPYLDSRAQKKGKVERPAIPPALQLYHRARSPVWLVARDSGFRCMACCHIFPSLEVLKEHVKHGLKEGFSCHTFHLTLASLKHKNWEEEGNKERNISDVSRKNTLL